MSWTVAVAAAIAAAVAFSSASADAQSPIGPTTVETPRAKGSTGPTFPGPGAEPLIATAPVPAAPGIYGDGQPVPADLSTSAPSRSLLPPAASNR